jgi:hypothetical protein
VSDVGDENGKYINDGEVIPRQVELQHVGWLLLDIGKGCPRGKMQEPVISSHIIGEWYAAYALMLLLGLIDSELVGVRILLNLWNDYLNSP